MLSLHRQIKKLSLLSLLSLKPTQRSLRRTFLLRNKILLPFTKKSYCLIPPASTFCFFPIASTFCFFSPFYLSFFFLFLAFLSFSSLTTSFSVTFERKKSKKVANRQKIINFAPRIVRNAQKRIIIIEKGWGIKATKTLNQKRGRSVCKDNLNEAKLRNYLMKRS